MSRSIGLALFCIITLVCMPAFAQEKKDEHAGHGGEMDAMMKMWQEVSTPGEAHQKLNSLVGKWNTESTMWMDPQNPTVSKGTAEIRWILGGRFLQQDMTGEMMGMPFTGTGVTGYDIYNMKYIGSWVDNSSTAMFTMEGSFDQSGKVLTMYGKMDEWMTGERDKTVKYVTRFTAPDAFAFEVHDLAIGETSTKVMQILYTRVK